MWCVAWYGMVWCMVWYGLVWCGMVWYDVVCGVVWYGVVYGMVWFGVVWYGMLCWGVALYGMVWYGMVFCTGNSTLRFQLSLYQHRIIVFDWTRLRSKMVPPMVHVQSQMIQWLLSSVLEYTDLQAYWHQGIFSTI